MAISYPLTPPATPATSEIEFGAHNIVGENVSPFTGSQQVLENQGEWWEAQVSVPPLYSRFIAESWVTFLTALRGKSGTFLLGVPGAGNPQGVATGTPVVDGAGQSGKTLATRGWTPSVTGILLFGDYMQIGTGATQRLYKVLVNGNSDGLGKVTFDIWPRLRESPADGASIVLTNPKGVFRLAENLRTWKLDNALIYQGIQFKCKEAF